MWFAWNVSILGISYGIYVFGIGLNVVQTIVAGTVGYLISCGLVGVLAVGGPRTGLPTLVQTRFAFGIRGNILPAFFAYLSNMGWKVTIITLASTTGANLFGTLWPGQFAKADGKPADGTIVVWFVIVLVATMSASVLGHAFIMKIEVWISWGTGLMTLAFLGFVLPEVSWSRLGDTPAGGPLAFVGGTIMAMTLVGLGFLNYGGDFARYLPRDTPARAVIGWTTSGLALPVVILLIVGALLVGGDPALGEAAAADPIGALTALLPRWFFVPFSIVIVISLMSAAITGIYSSGLALGAASYAVLTFVLKIDPQPDRSKLRSPVWGDGVTSAERARLVEIVENLLQGAYETEAEEDAALAEFEAGVRHPDASGLIFCPSDEFDHEPTSEEIVERALSYRAIEL